jgi:hypothetical protein
MNWGKYIRMSKFKLYTTFIVLVGAIILSACLSGCGGGGDGGSSSSGAPPPSSTPTQPTAKEQVQDLERRGELPQLDRSASILGPDANSNGIRDDVDNYIASLPITAEQKRAVEQLARALQATLLVDTADSNALRQASSAISRAVQCTTFKFPDINQDRSIYTRIEGITFNTKERSAIYIQYNEALSGSVFKDLTGDTCDN